MRYPRGFEPVSVREGVDGEWRVERFTVSEEDVRLTNMRMAFSPGMGGRTIPAGTYTRLMRGETCVMSDTPAEARDHISIYLMAKGDVLLNGLGIGFVLRAILNKPEVDSVTVVEKSPEVIQLVAPSYDDPRVTIVNADAMDWRPAKGRRFGAVWHDIWDYICSDNLDDMKKLHRSYGRRADWQGSWARELCEMGR